MSSASDFFLTIRSGYGIYTHEDVTSSCSLAISRSQPLRTTLHALHLHRRSRPSHLLWRPRKGLVLMGANLTVPLLSLSVF